MAHHGLDDEFGLTSQFMADQKPDAVYASVSGGGAISEKTHQKPTTTLEKMSQEDLIFLETGVGWDGTGWRSTSPTETRGEVVVPKRTGFLGGIKSLTTNPSEKVNKGVTTVPEKTTVTQEPLGLSEND